MNVRPCDFFDPLDIKLFHGIEVMVDGEWRLAGVPGKGMYNYEDIKVRDKEICRLRKTKLENLTPSIPVASPR